MWTALPSNRLLQERNRLWCVCALLAVFGSGIGVCFAATIGQPLLLMMRTAISSPVSIVGSFVSAFLPYFLSCVVILISRPPVRASVCCLLISRFATVAWCIDQSFRSAGWLIRYLAQLPDMILLSLLVLIATQQHYNTRKSIILGYFTACLLPITLFQYYCISPFLVILLSN